MLAIAMPQLIVDVDEAIVQALQAQAAVNGCRPEAELSCKAIYWAGSRPNAF